MLRSSPLREWHESFAAAPESVNANVLASVAIQPRDTTVTLRPGAATGHRTAITTLETIPYGPPAAPDAPPADTPDAVELVATYGPVQVEYAAIRRGCAIMDCPHRGTLIVTGAARRDFLNRMLTAELAGLNPGIAARSFWLNRKGRVQADLLLAELGDRIVIDLDIHAAAPTAASLSEFLFAEDVSITDASADVQHIALHGPHALTALAAAANQPDLTLEPLHAATLTVAGHAVTAIRADACGVPGFALIVPVAGVIAVWSALLETRTASVRPIGWHGYNIARIEAGTPLFNIDFGTTSLPHETGILRERVSFTKGCYLGQEIVARMESLGQPKQMLVGLRMLDDSLPVAGAQVFAAATPPLQSATAPPAPLPTTPPIPGAHLESPIGIVTSSTLAPMLSSKPIAFATLRTAHASPGTRIIVNAEGRQAAADVSSLSFLPAAHAVH